MAISYLPVFHISFLHKMLHDETLRFPMYKIILPSIQPHDIEHMTDSLLTDTVAFYENDEHDS